MICVVTFGLLLAWIPISVHGACTTSHDQELSRVDRMDVFQFSLSAAGATRTIPLLEPASTDFPVVLLADDPEKRGCQSGFVYWEYEPTCPTTTSSYKQPWSANTPVSIPGSAQALMFAADLEESSNPSEVVCSMNACAGLRCTDCNMQALLQCSQTRDTCASAPCECVTSFHQCVAAANCYWGSVVNDIQGQCSSIANCPCPSRPASEIERTTAVGGGMSGGDGPADEVLPFFMPGSPFFAAFLAGVILVVLFIILCVSLCIFCMFCRPGEEEERSRRGRSRRGTGGSAPKRSRRSTRRGSRARTLGGVEGGGSSTSMKPQVNVFPCEICGAKYPDRSDLLMHLGMKHPELAQDRAQLSRTASTPGFKVNSR